MLLPALFADQPRKPAKVPAIARNAFLQRLGLSRSGRLFQIVVRTRPLGRTPREYPRVYFIN
jgi:hypothetical protein